MSDRDRDERNRSETDQLRAAARRDQPPQALERRVIDRLRDEGLIEARSTWSQRARRAALGVGALAASLLLVFLGFVLGRQASSAPGGGGPAVGSYLLLLRGGEAPADEEALQASVSRMVEWVGDVRSRGLALQGERLEESGWLIEQPAGVARSYSARSSSATAAIGVAGYFRVDGVSRDEAIELAASCPFLFGGGAVELRRIAGESDDQGGDRE